MNLLDQLKRHEGFRAHPYQDTVGKWTIGYGRNLDDVGITIEEATMLLIHDVLNATKAIRTTYPWYLHLDEVRQGVIVNMVFNMGLTRFAGFKKMIAAIERNDFVEAADQMLDSKWAVQVKGRANELAKMMLHGQSTAERI